MWRKHSKIFLILLIVSLFLPTISFAGELKVLDSMGLTRAVKRVDNGASVRVETRNDTATQISLTHVDGLAPDISGSRQDDGSYVFRNVTQGSWRLTVEGQDVVISQVRIE